MADFDDTFDPELGAACNRLAAFVEQLPEGAVIDPASQLTERDLALILRRLYATRHAGGRGRHHESDAAPGWARLGAPYCEELTGYGRIGWPVPSPDRLQWLVSMRSWANPTDWSPVSRQSGCLTSA
jgi:hypothetical protein